MSLKQRPVAPSGRRRGGRRRVQFVLHPDTDVPIQNLRRHKASGRYYRIHQNKREYYGTNLRESIAEHELAERDSPGAHSHQSHPAPTWKKRQKLSRDAKFWARVRREILKDQKNAAKKTGIPELAKLKIGALQQKQRVTSGPTDSASSQDIFL
jgi:hypothetical protein